MTTVQRAYINPSYEQYVDDGCLEWKSVPMAVVRDVLKVSHDVNEYDGIKQIYNVIPPRPKNINAMATSIARINQLTYSSAVPLISKKLIDEETERVRGFVGLAPPEYDPAVPEMRYTAEQPVRSSSGERLVPATTFEMIDNPKYRMNTASMILGDVEPTSGVVPFNMDTGSQTEWIMNKEAGYLPVDKGFARVSMPLEYPEYFSGEVGFENRRTFNIREGVAVQTSLSKPPSKRNITEGPEYFTTPAQTGQLDRFYEHPDDRFGTLTGTPTRQLSRGDKITRGAMLMGEHHTPRRPGFAGDSATSGLATPGPK